MPLSHILTRWRGAIAGGLALGAAAVLVLGGVALYLLYVTDARLRSTAEFARQLNDARRQVRMLLAAVDQAEAAEHAHLLTGDSGHIASFRLAKERVDHALALLAASPLASTARLYGLAELADNARKFLAELDRGVALFDAGQREAAIATAETGAGNALAQRVRVLGAGMADDLTAEADSAFGAHQREEAAALTFAMGGVLFAGVLSLTLCIAVVAWLRAQRHAEAALLAGRDAAQAANQAKSRFLAAVSHDVRQPLHAITLFVAALRRRVEGAEAKAIVDNIDLAAQSMQRVFNALLDAARLDAGAIPVQPRSFALEEVLERLRVRFARIAAAKGLALSIPETHLFVWTDPVLLESILHNLVSNAVSYTERGGVALTARRLDQMLQIEVADTGPGIPADRLDEIFDEFTRLGPAELAVPGVGLGLAIVRRLAEMLGARVSVDSTPGAGSRFTVSLPFVPGELTTPPPAEAAAEPDLAGLRILLLDDDPLVLQATAAEVTAWGSRALPAGSAAEAMAIMERLAPAVPDAAIIDQDITGDISGVGVLDRIAARFGVALPAVVVTGVTTADVREELTDSGHPWLLKPADPAVLRRLLARSIADAQGHPQRPVPIDG